jgi:hypothetical protein
MRFLYTTAIAVLAHGVLLGNAASAHETVAKRPQSASQVHCSCIAEAGDRYDPFADYSDPHMPTTGAEEGLNRWAYVESLYKNCMIRKSARPAENPFPYGVDNYPGGNRLNPANCAS